MSSEDCATQINNSLNQDPRCADNSQDKVPVSPVEKVAVFSVIYGIIFLVTIVGNGFVCIVITRRKDMRTLTNLFLLNMAISDLLSALFAIPSLMSDQISPSEWPLGGFMCRAVRVISSISVSVSVYTMVVLAVERYQAIVNPFTVRASRKKIRRTVILMGLTWLVSCAIAAPQAFVVTTKYKRCVEDWTGKGGIFGNQIYTVLAFILLFVLPILVIGISYIMIIRTLWQPEPSLSDDARARSGRGFSPTNSQPSYSANRAYAINRMKKKRKTTYMLLTVIVTFMTCMLPFQVVVLLRAFIQLPYETVGFSVFVNFSSVLALCSMACNPFIYSFFSDKFRKACVDVFRCRCEEDGQQAPTTSVLLVSSTMLQTG
ncbi:orexin receptor type 2-like [Stylophora pistillata]|uniref:orexin receptor type 2-like n=1 Tax=Stylophora pistillata TaxID=50429 RepID=UPI000C050D45|nr:orexin receptor type 2-like [Stylophora pistillata]